MINRSTRRDYDISYHTRAIENCVQQIREHAQALKNVCYDAYNELDNAEDQCAILKEESSDI